MLKRSRYILTAILGTALADASVMAADPVPAPAQSVDTINFLRRATPHAAPCPTCPQQAVPVVPYNPNVPVVPYNPNAPKVDPNQPMQPQPVAPVAPDVSTLARADQGGTSAIHTNAPNLFGDLFGAKASIITRTTTSSRIVTSQTTGVLSTNAFRAGNTITNQGIGGGPATTTFNVSIPSIPGASGSQTVPFVGFVETGVPPTGVPAGNNVQFTPNPANVQAVANIVNPLLAAPNGQLYVAAANAISANSQATLNSLTFGNTAATQANFTGTQLEYLLPITSTTSVATSSTTVIGLPTPGAGGVVGLLKISEDNSPFPRDRVIFTYDYFDNTQINAGGTGAFGIPVNRYQFGFEKTLFQGRASFEVRVPFASTQSSSSVIGQESLGTEFGNVRLTAKALLRKGEVLNFSGGLGISLPTADDISLTSPGVGEVVHVQNKSVQLSPFLAVQLTPNERLFAQGWYGFCFDTGGNGVTINPGFFSFPGTNPLSLGNLTSASLMTVDGQIGYWIYQSAQGLFRGVAPFVELHYTGDVSKGTTFRANNLLIGDATNYQEFNVTAGVTTRLAQNTTLAVAAAAPLLNQNSRTFDYQIGVRLNWYFGYTARQRQNGSASNLAPNSF